MVIDMSEQILVMLSQLRQFLEGTAEVKCRRRRRRSADCADRIYSPS